MTVGEMIGWHHQLDGREFEQTLGVGNGQESLVCPFPCALGFRPFLAQIWGTQACERGGPSVRKPSRAGVGTSGEKNRSPLGISLPQA